MLSGKRLISMLINLLNGKINRYSTAGSVHHMKKEETQKPHAGTLMAFNSLNIYPNMWERRGAESIFVHRKMVNHEY